MSTISAPLPPILDEFVKRMVKEGKAHNKADVVRKALELLEEKDKQSDKSKN